VKEEVRF